MGLNDFLYKYISNCAQVCQYYALLQRNGKYHIVTAMRQMFFNR